MPDCTEILDRVAALLADARRVLFITGAGISADSGLPTYRGVGGLYNSGEAEAGLPIEVALSGECFAARPEITWKYLAQIGDACRHAEPNPAHRAIALLEDYLDAVVVFTQNVDGLHARAGSSQLIEIHGNLSKLICPRCSFEALADTGASFGWPPRCPDCGAVLRPPVVLFGEALPGQALDRLMTELERGFDLVFVIGTTGAFPYIVEPVLWAAEAGVPTVEINPQVTRLTSCLSCHVPLGAAVAMTGLLERLAIFPDI